MTLLCVWMLHSIFGMVVEVAQMSTKDRLERKKYMGVWRWESELMAKMMSRFPNAVIRHMERKNPNMRGCSVVLLKNSEEEIPKLLFDSLVPCSGGNYTPKKKKSNNNKGQITWLIFTQSGMAHFVEMISFTSCCQKINFNILFTDQVLFID